MFRSWRDSQRDCGGTDILLNRRRVLQRAGWAVAASTLPMQGTAVGQTTVADLPVSDIMTRLSTYMSGPATMRYRIFLPNGLIVPRLALRPSRFPISAVIRSGLDSRNRDGSFALEIRFSAAK